MTTVVHFQYKCIRDALFPDGQRFEREIRAFPALAQTYTKKDKRHDLDACLGESVGFMERSECGAE